MHAVFFTVFFCLCVGITVVDSGRWSKWQDLTICSAKPCKCKGYTHRCEQGKKVMIRSCIYAKDEMSVCQNKRGVGSIKLDVKCRNKRVCPGWSDWMPKEKCNCDTKMQGFVRLCNNPSPIHPGVLCWDDSAGDGAKELFEVRNCNCTDEERKAWMTTTTTTVRTTTPTTGEPTTPLPWCCDQGNDYDYDYGDNTIDLYDYLDSLENQTTTTTSKPEPPRKNQLPPTDCTPCTSEHGYADTTERDEERKAWMTTTTVRTTTPTTGEHTTPLPWCCDQGNGYDYNYGDNTIGLYDYLDSLEYQPTTTTSKPEPTRKKQMPPTDCTPCSSEYGHTDITESDEERKAWMTTTTTTVRTTTPTTGEPTTPLPWCCDQGNGYDYNYGDNTIDLDDYLDSLDYQPTTTTSKREPTRKKQQPPTDCIPCTSEYGYADTTETDEERKAWMTTTTTTVRTTTPTTGEPTTPLPWCCDQGNGYDYNYGDNTIDLDDYLDSLDYQTTSTTSKREPTRKSQLPPTDCTPCTSEYIYSDTTESDEERKAWMTTTTVRTTTPTTGEPTTPLPWCCDQGNGYDYNYGDNTIDLDDYLDSLDYQTTTTTSKREPTRKKQQPPTDCIPCTSEYGYADTTETGEDNWMDYY